MLTGRLTWRRGWLGRLILQVEVRAPDTEHGCGRRRGDTASAPPHGAARWRDARQTDLAALGLATLKGK